MCVSKSKKYRISKKQLLDIVVSYIKHNKPRESNEGNINLEIHLTTSTPKKRHLPSLENSPLLPAAKRSQENSLAEHDNVSYFDELLDTSSDSHLSLHLVLPETSILPSSMRKLSPSMKKLCLSELSTNGQLTDISINAFCVRE